MTQNTAAPHSTGELLGPGRELRAGRVPPCRQKGSAGLPGRSSALPCCSQAPQAPPPPACSTTRSCLREVPPRSGRSRLSASRGRAGCGVAGGGPGPRGEREGPGERLRSRSATFRGPEPCRARPWCPRPDKAPGPGNVARVEGRERLSLTPLLAREGPRRESGRRLAVLGAGAGGERRAVPSSGRESGLRRARPSPAGAAPAAAGPGAEVAGTAALGQAGSCKELRGTSGV